MILAHAGGLNDREEFHAATAAICGLARRLSRVTARGHIDRVRLSGGTDREVWTNIGLGRDGVIGRDDKVALRQMGMDRIAIAAIIKQTRDGGRLTKAEMTTIAKGFIWRHNPICRRPNPPRYACGALYDAPTKK